MNAGILPSLLLLVSAAHAQTDYFGRDISASRLTAPPQRLEHVAAMNLVDSPYFTLLPYESRATSSWADAVAIGDVSGDGRADVVVATGRYFQANDYHLFLFRQDSSGTLLSPEKFPYAQAADTVGIVVADLDGHDGLDVAVAGNSGVTVFHSTPLTGWLTNGGVVTSQLSNDVGALNLHGSGRPDLISLNYNGGALYANDGAGAFTATPWANAATGLGRMAIGDLDGDGVSDVAVASTQSLPTLVRLIRNNGNGTLTQMGTLDGLCNNFSADGIGIGDVNHDGVNDVVVSGGGNRPTACVLVYYGRGSGRFAPGIVISTYECPETLRVADVNNDGREDVIVLHGGWMALGVYLQQADGSLASELLFPVPYATQYSRQALAVGDFTGDGYPDIAIADYGSGLTTLVNATRIFADGF